MISSWRRRRTSCISHETGSRALRPVARRPMRGGGAPAPRAAHALARQPHAAANLLERLRLGVVEPETQSDDLPLEVGQAPQHGTHAVATQCYLGRLLGGSSPASKSARTVSCSLPIGWSRLTEARAAARTPLRLLERQVRLRGDLFQRRLAPEPRGTACARRALYLAQGARRCAPASHGPRLVGDPASDRLPDPPCRIGRELESPAIVEFLGGAHRPMYPPGSGRGRGKPWLRYFFAIGKPTRRRFASTIDCFAPWSPRSIRFASSTSWAAVSRSNLAMSFEEKLEPVRRLV